MILIVIYYLNTFTLPFPCKHQQTSKHTHFLSSLLFWDSVFFFLLIITFSGLESDEMLLGALLWTILPSHIEVDVEVSEISL